MFSIGGLHERGVPAGDSTKSGEIPTQPTPQPEAVVGPDFRWPLSEGPYLWGTLNLTEDSFYGPSRVGSVDEAVARAQRMEDEGAAAIDLGAESSRPGAQPVGTETEWKRIAPVLRALAHVLRIPISVDTYKAEIARRASLEGAQIINSIGSIRWDLGMADVLLELDLPVVLMHALDRPSRMQNDPRYRNVGAQVADYLKADAQRLLAGGMERSKIILDPGIGFGKTLQHNLSLISGCRRLGEMGFAVLLGASRKSFIGKLDRDCGPEDRLGGSLGAAIAGARSGADILRVHDVAPTRQALQVASAVWGVE